MADDVEGARLGGGLDGVGMDAHAPHALGGVVHARAVLDLDDPSLRQRHGEAAHDAREGLVARRVGEGVGRLVELLGQDRRQDLGELHEGADDLGVELVGGLGEEAGGEEEGHGLRQRQRQRRQEGIGLQAEAAAVVPDGQAAVEVHGLEVAVDGPLGDADLPGQRRRRDALLAVGMEDLGDAQVAGGAIPLATRRARRRCSWRGGL